jgi:hypothetical protein
MNNSVVSSEKKNSKNLQEEGKAKTTCLMKVRLIMKAKMMRLTAVMILISMIVQMTKLKTDDMINKLLPCPLQQRKTKAVLEKEAKEKVRQRKRSKKPETSATVDITTVQQRAERYKS